jgi:hypothetical protein
MIRVAAADAGTSSLDLLVLEDGVVCDQCRFEPEQIDADPAQPTRWHLERGSYDLVAGPSGYGLPLTPARDCSDLALALMTLVRPDDPAPSRRGVLGFRAVIEAMRASSLPVVFFCPVLFTFPRCRRTSRPIASTLARPTSCALQLWRSTSFAPLQPTSPVAIPAWLNWAALSLRSWSFLLAELSMAGEARRGLTVGGAAAHGTASSLT